MVLRQLEYIVALAREKHYSEWQARDREDGIPLRRIAAEEQLRDAE